MKVSTKIVKLFKQVKSNEISSKLINNTSWLISDKLLTMIIGIFVMAIVARYLGPENYGVYNYALAFVTLFSIFSTLGLETISIKSIVNKQEEEGIVLFTSLVLRVIGGIVLTFFSSIVVKFIAPNEPLIHNLVLLMSLAMIFKSLEVIEYWIQAHQKSKVSSLIRMGAYVITSILKVTFVFLEGNLLHLALIYMFDVVLIGCALLIAYFKIRWIDTKWRFNLQYAINVLSQSWYLILSGLMITLYMQIDKVMLGSMLPSKEELGVYSAATQISTMWYFVPLAIITSFKPAIFKFKLESEESYLKIVQTLYSIIAWLGIIFGVLTLMFSDIMVSILYGQEYIDASDIIFISVWAGTFATLGTARAIWLLTENLQRYSIVQTFTGLVINVGLNLLLIPSYGGLGAAIATLISQIIVNIVVLSFFKKTRISNVMILKAFSPKHLVNYIWK